MNFSRSLFSRPLIFSFFFFHSSQKSSVEERASGKKKKKKNISFVLSSIPASPGSPRPESERGDSRVCSPCLLVGFEKERASSKTTKERNGKRDEERKRNSMAENATTTTTTTSTSSASTSSSFRVSIKHWRAVASWTWDAGDDVCGICRAAFDACPPEAKYPGDDAPVVWGACGHAFHLQCISRWLANAGGGAAAGQQQQRCPFCRRPWEFKSAGVEEEEEAGAAGGGAGGGGTRGNAAATTTTGNRRPPAAVAGGAARTARRARTTADASPSPAPPTA